MKATWALETIITCWLYLLTLSRSVTGKQSFLPLVNFVLLILLWGHLCPEGPASPPALEDRRGQIWPNALHQAGAMPSSPVSPEPPGSSACIIRLY